MGCDSVEARGRKEVTFVDMVGICMAYQKVGLMHGTGKAFSMHIIFSIVFNWGYPNESLVFIHCS